MDQVFQKLLESRKPNKFENFYKLLADNEFKAAVQLLQLQKRDQKHEFFRRLAEFYSKTMSNGEQPTKSTRQIACNELLTALKDFDALQQEDMDTVMDGGDPALLAILTAKRPDWCELLVLALLQAEKVEELEQLLPGFAEFVQQQHGVDKQQLSEMVNNPEPEEARRMVAGAVQRFLDCNQQLRAPEQQQQQEQAASGFVGMPLPPIAAGAAAAAYNGNGCDDACFEKKATEGMSTLALADAEETQDERQSKQQLREYQRELAAPGLSGKNCVIIAPTGSGKTLVSIRIAERKLRNTPRAKVAFLADRTQLVDQQYEEFKKQLPEEFRVKLLRGGNAERFPISYSLEDYSVFILSTQILLNNLNDTDEDGLNGDIWKFHLLIFDECHHCDKEHPSKKIMDHYFDFRERSGSRDLPQVVGLTASPGTGGANRQVEALQHVMRICANLDCHELVTPRESLESLQQHVSDPKAELHCVPAKDDDGVQAEIERLMAKAETILQTVARSAQVKLPRPPARGSFMYTNFCGTLHRQVSLLSDDVSKAVYACWRCLTDCNIAHFISSLFRSTDAVQYIRAKMMEPSSQGSPTCEEDKELQQELMKRFCEMERFCETRQRDAATSPALEKLRKLLVRQFEHSADSRVIVFVQQRCFTTAVKAFIDESGPELLAKCAGTGVMTGANAAGDSGGITQNAQTDILQDFRRGDIKILISTSVSEEGLDIRKCNMVVRFCHVTNEIAMVQSKGRGRAEDSTYHVIVPDQLSWLEQKEETNKQRDKMMKRAVEQISVMPKDDFRAKIAELQSEQMCHQTIQATVRRQAAASAAAPSAAPASGGARQEAPVYRLLCKGCNGLACTSLDLRKADKHYVVVCDEIVTEGRFRIANGPADGGHPLLNSSLRCGSGHCSQKWGSLRKYKGVLFPMLEVKSFKFFNARSNSPINVKKWSDTEASFSVARVTPEELARRAESLPDAAYERLTDAAAR